MPEAKTIYLASQSPRRRDLLAQIGLQFLTIEVQIPEIPHANENAYAFAKRMALTKAKAGWQHKQRSYSYPVLGADTVVVLEGLILGKPRDQQHAINMLTQLSNKTHQVITAVAMVNEQQEALAVSVSEVTLRALTLAEIQYYWSTGEPQDKAGAYAIQGLAAAFVSNLKGSYSGVMGLPLFETAELLNKFGIAVLA
jgi:septum formation protein